MNRYAPIVRIAALIVALASMISACTLRKPTEADVIGSWFEYRNKDTNLPGCGTFRFFEDGHFVADNIPRKYIVNYFLEPFAPDRFDGQGSWDLDTSSNDPLAAHEVNLHFAENGMFPEQFDSGLLLLVGGGMLQAGADAQVLFKRGENCE